MTIAGCMEVARQVSTQTKVPLILMGYYNPIMAYGITRFCQKARQSGVCGLIIPDLPPEEAEPLRIAAQQQGLTLIFLIPPTTPDARIARIVELSSEGLPGFIYCVSLSGVTGARQELPPHLHTFAQRVRSYTQPKHLPIAIGFGLSTPEHVAQVAQCADGAVVGSALVHLIDQHEEGEQEQAVQQYIQSLRQK
jgi:tryptophan synthase alpha chain